MMKPAPIEPSDIRSVTQARLTLGARGRALDTRSALAFALDHAAAREAVLSELDLPRIGADLAAVDLDHVVVASAAETRETYIKRPDLGRRLSPASAKELSNHRPVDVALVLADGLSAIAVALNGVAFLHALSQRLTHRGLTCAPVVVSRQARVALGDEVAARLRAKTVVIALGERPGLSAADSLGAYITQNPGPATADSARNCISNIREAGLSVADAADAADRLIVAMRHFGASGVALSQALASGRLTGPER